MLETSKDLLWVALAISALALTAYLCYLLYSLAKIVQEAKKTVEDVNKKLDKVNPTLDSATETINSLLETLQTINNSILKPIASVSAIFKKIKNVASILRGKK
jgi:uncharacterized protein YoxC